MLKAPELSPLAPCNVGVCHLPLFHVIWYKYTKWAEVANGAENGLWNEKRALKRDGSENISKTPSVWHVWRQTCQTQPDLHIRYGDISTLATP